MKTNLNKAYSIYFELIYQIKEISWKKVFYSNIIRNNARFNNISPLFIMYIS